MHVLIVHAHPEPASFNAALKETAVAALTGLGHQVEVSDLYAMRFDPVLRAEEFPRRANPDYFKVQLEQRHAAETVTHAADVAAEHEKIRRAGLVIFQFPLWWGSMPAIMKGYVDRVFSLGTLYGRGVTTAHGKKAMVSVTTGGGQGTPEEIAREVLRETEHIHLNMLGLPGFTVLPPFVAPGPGQMTPEQREQVLAEYRQRLAEVVSA